MRSLRIVSDLFKKNRSKLRSKIPPRSLALICSNHQMPRNGDQYYPFRQNSDFYYLTGIVQEESILLILPDHPNPEWREVLFILKPTPKMEIWEGHKLTQAEAKSTSGIEQVLWLDEFDNTISEAIQFAGSIYFNLSEDTKFKPRVKPFDFQLMEKIEAKFPGHSKGELGPIMTRLRMFKEPEELETIVHACKITENAFRRVLPLVRPGILEYEIEAEIVYEFIRSGAEGHAYEPIIASGKNALVLHYVRNNKICRNGEVILMDFGAEYMNYAADCSRTIPVDGRFTKRQKELYILTLKILRKAISLMTVGKNLVDYHTEVGMLWQEEHLKLGLYTKEDVANQNPASPKWKEYYMHGTSHSIGLDVHDPFDRSVPFSAGMVLSCEPAIYLPEEDIGIRLENTILITNNGPVDLMKNIPIEPDEIEDLMNRSI